MAQYGYTYRSAQISTYNTSNVRNIETGAKPFAPYVPKFNNGHGYSEGHVTNKKIIPVASSPYYDDEESDDEEEGKHPRKFDDFRTNEASRSPPRSSSHLTSPDWRHSSQPIPSYNGYADHDGNGAARKPTNHDHYTSPVKKDNYHHGYDGYGDYNNKDDPKPKPMSKPKPTECPVYNSGYGNDYNNREGPKLMSKSKPTECPVYNSGYGGDYNNIEGPKLMSKSKPTEYPVYNSGYGGDYNNMEGPKLMSKPKPTEYPIYNSGYGGNYNNMEGPKLMSKPKPTASPVYNSGYSGDYNREGPKPKPTGFPVYKNGYDGGYGSGSASPTRHDNYDHDNDYGNYHNKHGGPKLTSGWTDSPRKGIQLTKATNNIDEAMKLLMKEAAMLNGNGNGNELVYSGSGPKQYEYEKKAHHDGPGPLGSRPTPPPPASTYDRSMNLVNETERLKNIVTGGGGAPHQTQPRPSVPMKEETRANGNFNLAPMRQRFKFGDDGRRPDYDNRRGYGVINHKEAEKKFNGVTLDHKEPEDKFNDMTI